MYRPLPDHKKNNKAWLIDWAHQIVSHNVRVGKLYKPSECADCGVLCNPHAHHHDYEKPLDVLWVCRKCHANIHKQIRLNKAYQLDNYVYPRAVEIARSYFI